MIDVIQCNLGNNEDCQESCIYVEQLDIPTSLLEVLHKNNIFTVRHCLVNQKLSEVCNLSEETYHELVLLCYEAISTDPMEQTGLQLFDKFSKSRRLLKTSIDGLDGLLGGGVATGEICELCGDAYSFKDEVWNVWLQSVRQVAMWIAMKIAENHRVVLIASCFTSMSHLSPSHQALQNLHIVMVFDWMGLLDAVHSLPVCDLLVVQRLSSFLPQSFQHQAQVGLVMESLQQTAHQAPCAVLTTCNKKNSTENTLTKQTQVTVSAAPNMPRQEPGDKIILCHHNNECNIYCTLTKSSTKKTGETAVIRLPLPTYS
eukprot:Platyproteum_vivax@DN14003_c0_g1_i1.p1